jgi:oligopeptide/dipeptide ABC transporter ATP-binding protein
VNVPRPHLLDVQRLETHFHTFEGVARAVDDVSFYLERGEVLGVVGESGCGKSVTAQSVMRLIPEPPGKIVGGRILFDDMDLAAVPLERMESIRGNRIAMIFQEPMTSLNPVYTIGDQIAEMFQLHRKLSRAESWNRAIEMLAKVQIPAPERRVQAYPHQLSGGMRQRAMIAMALSCNPAMLIADEPTTALDVTVQAQILKLFRSVQTEHGMSLLYITHDLGVVAAVADRVYVMYAGVITEQGDVRQIFRRPHHPYTQGLLAALPSRSRRGERLHSIPGSVPDPSHKPPGCPFHPRCPHAEDACRERFPEMCDWGEGHQARCPVLFRKET